jgi:hypothetical protein
MRKSMRKSLLYILPTVSLIMLSCSFAKPYDVKLVSDKRPPGKIIGILSFEGRYKKELFFPVILNGQKATIYNDPLLQQPVKTINLPGEVLSYFLKNNSIDTTESEEYDKIYLVFLCRGSTSNTIVLYQFDYSNLIKGNVNETRSASFSTKADKIISISHNDKDHKALLVCQSNDNKLLYLSDPWGKTGHVKSFESPILFADLRYSKFAPMSPTMAGYDGKIVYFYKFVDGQLLVDFKIDLGTEGDLAKSVINDMNHLEGYSYGWLFNLYDGRTIHLIDISNKSIIYSREFLDVTFTKQLGYEFYFGSNAMFYISTKRVLDSRLNNAGDFIASRLFDVDYIPLSYVETPDVSLFYFCQYNQDSTLVYDMEIVRDNQNRLFRKHPYKEIPGKVVNVLFLSYKIYFYTEDSVWECDYINSEEGRYELVRMDLGPEYKQK